MNESESLLRRVQDYNDSAFVWDKRSGITYGEIKRVCRELVEAKEVLGQLMEFWDNGTPVHNGSDVSNDARALLAKLEHE